jgi:hypothetical protein
MTSFVGHRIAGIFRCRRKTDGKEVLLCFFQCGTAVTRSMLNEISVVVRRAVKTFR